MAPPATPVLWFLARNLSGLSDGAAVTTWSSAIGTSTASQGTGANQPTKQTVSGEHCVRFDGSNDSLSLNGDALTFSQNIGAITLFVKAKIITLPASFAMLTHFSSGTSTSQGRAYIDINSGGTMETGGRRLDADAVDETATGTPGTTDVHVFGGLYDYTNSDLFTYIDGAQTGTDASFQAAGSTSNTASQAVAFGADTAGTSHFLNYDLYEVLVYNRALTAPEVAQVQEYLVPPPNLTFSGMFRSSLGAGFRG